MPRLVFTERYASANVVYPSADTGWKEDYGRVYDVKKGNVVGRGLGERRGCSGRINVTEDERIM